MATEYLSEVFQLSKSNPKAINAVQFIIQKTHSDLISSPIVQAMRAPRKSSLNNLISKLHLKSQNDEREELLRKEKLKEAKTQKRMLQEQLMSIQESIRALDEIDETADQANKINLQNSRVRREYLEMEKKKCEEASMLARKFYLEQKRLQKKWNKKLKERDLMIEEDLKAKQQELEAENLRKEEEYKEYLERMQLKKEKRQQELEEMKKLNSYYEEIKKKKPLYVKIEEKYKSEYEMPELEKRKAELAKKRMMYQPVKLEEIAEHAKWYDTIKHEQQKKVEREQLSKLLDSQIRLSETMRSSWSARILEHDKLEKEAQEAQREERLKMIEKKTRYAELVKEMFQPSIDRAKQQELQERIEQQVNPPKHKISKTIENTLAYNSPIVKWKPGLKKPKAKEEAKKEVKVFDYLGHMRKVREDQLNEQNTDNLDIDWENDIHSNLPAAEKAKRIKAKADKLEKKCKRKEMVFRSSMPANLKAIKQSESVDNLLINSIKAKLAVLEYTGNNEGYN
ncbi:unnamed protein product [Blepharisma stoltei]|uniref:Uncharacterized protein n=1 Tax=Blepharisma stoltei TaxID=1481888 RepID=A0AAU9IXA4_9CILI|nr:unnamed protein product [Blepharisma stoltei]